MRRFTLLAFVFAVTGSGPALAQSEAAFAPCAACHSLEKGKNGIGPSLFGVFGRKKASAPGYDYSPALKAKGGVWSAAELDGYIAGSSVAVPGTKMAFAGFKDPAMRAAVIALLKSKR